MIHGPSLWRSYSRFYRATNTTRKCVAAVLGREITEEEWQVIQLPGPLGGFALRLPAASADAAFYSTWAATKHKVAMLCSSLGRPCVCDPVEQPAKAVASRLLQQGEVTAVAVVKLTPEAAESCERRDHRLNEAENPAAGFHRLSDGGHRRDRVHGRGVREAKERHQAHRQYGVPVGDYRPGARGTQW